MCVCCACIFGVFSIEKNAAALYHQRLAPDLYVCDGECMCFAFFGLLLLPCEFGLFRVCARASCPFRINTSCHCTFGLHTIFISSIYVRNIFPQPVRSVSLALSLSRTFPIFLSISRSAERYFSRFVFIPASISQAMVGPMAKRDE